MSGRRRRASTSSVETVEDNHVRWLQETSVVRSVPKDSPSDSWPTFELRDVVVFDREGKVLENALHVGVRGPFIVRGHLVIDDPALKTHTIEIRHCTSYAIGESEDDGRPVVWISGRGGWYEISPSDAYLPIYNKMCEATTMYYSIMDTYHTKNLKRPHRKTSQSSRLEALYDVFLQYTIRIGDGSTFDEVVERCAEHASFFVCQFAQEDVGQIDWKRTGFYKWFMVEHADAVQEFEELSKNPRPLPRTPSVEPTGSMPREKSSARVTRSISIEEVGPAQFAVPQQQRPTKASSTPREKEAASSVVDESTVIPTQPAEETMVDAAAAADGGDSPFASLLAAFDHIYNKKGASKKGLTISGTLNDFYFDFRFPSYRDGTVGSHKIPVVEVLHYNASALLQSLDNKYQKHEIYSFLQELAGKEFAPVALKLSSFPYQIVPRKPSPRVAKKPEKGELPPPLAIENVSNQIGNGDGVETDEPRRAGKSLKRPGRRPGRKSGLRMATSSSKKRAHDALESGSESESEASGLKRTHYFSDGEGEGDGDGNGDGDGDVAMEDADEAGPSGSGDADGEPIKIVIRAVKIPSTVPRGPDGTWTCDQQGCDYIVRGGDEEECLDRIRRHFDEHEQHTRVSLAVSESSRGHVSINHLLDKLKRVGAKVNQSQQLSIGGQPLPQPIKRKLIA